MLLLTFPLVPRGQLCSHNALYLLLLHTCASLKIYLNRLVQVLHEHKPKEQRGRLSDLALHLQPPSHEKGQQPPDIFHELQNQKLRNSSRHHLSEASLQELT
uniref:Uncharacterized protein n=1 Tax=Opuntia streptacantha TaxID=393608 RepID=A0A7C9AGC3_OPUST